MTKLWLTGRKQELFSFPQSYDWHLSHHLCSVVFWLSQSASAILVFAALWRPCIPQSRGDSRQSLLNHRFVDLILGGDSFVWASSCILPPRSPGCSENPRCNRYSGALCACFWVNAPLQWQRWRKDQFSWNPGNRKVSNICNYYSVQELKCWIRVGEHQAWLVPVLFVLCCSIRSLKKEHSNLDLPRKCCNKRAIVLFEF